MDNSCSSRFALLKRSLKLVSAILYQFFIFHQMIALPKLWNFYFFYLISSLRSWDFCIFIFPSYFPVSHCFRGWSKKNLKIYDVINCLNKNLMKAGLYDDIFLSRPWNFYSERRLSKYFWERNVCREILFSLFTQSSFTYAIMITFHS